MDIKDIMTPNAVAAAEMTEYQRVNSQHRRSAVAPESSIPQGVVTTFPSLRPAPLVNHRWVLKHRDGRYWNVRTHGWVTGRAKASSWASKENADASSGHRYNDDNRLVKIRILTLEVGY